MFMVFHCNSWFLIVSFRDGTIPAHSIPIPIPPTVVRFRFRFRPPGKGANSDSGIGIVPSLVFLQITSIWIWIVFTEGGFGFVLYLIEKLIEVFGFGFYLRTIHGFDQDLLVVDLCPSLIPNKLDYHISSAVSLLTLNVKQKFRFGGVRKFQEYYSVILQKFAKIMCRENLREDRREGSEKMKLFCNVILQCCFQPVTPCIRVSQSPHRFVQAQAKMIVKSITLKTLHFF